MSEKWIREYEDSRTRLNEMVFSSGHLGVKRFFALDEQAYHEGSLSTKTKELMGLASSMVLRCDDCITYHIIRCYKEGVTKEEFYEAFNVALIVGGSIIIPHLRIAAEKIETLFD